jgi:hypothetical protein
MSPHLVFGEKHWSRRSLMSLLAGAAASTSAVLMSSEVRAQAGTWREYRNDELGFRVEFPVEPKIELEEAERGDVWIRSADAHVDVDQMTLGASSTEFRSAISAEDDDKLHRAGMNAGGMPVTREEAQIVSGVAARDFIRESDDLNYIHRRVVVGTKAFMASAIGDRSIHGHPTVRRFLDSLALLRGGR